MIKMIKVEFLTDGAAFEDNFDGSLTYIFFQVRKWTREQQPESGTLVDLNGNTIGEIREVKSK